MSSDVAILVVAPDDPDADHNMDFLSSDKDISPSCFLKAAEALTRKVDIVLEVVEDEDVLVE